MRQFEILRKYNTDAESSEWEANPNLSVIVPSSNSADYILNCLESLLTQVGISLETIVVDYESVDRTIEIVQNFANQHPVMPTTIVAQHKPGLGDARNFGLSIARGEFVAFLDSDDYFSANCYSKMVAFGQENECDIVFAKASVFSEANFSNYPFYDSHIWDGILQNQTGVVFKHQLERRVFATEPNASLKISRRSFLADNNIRYPEGKRAEDLLVHFRMIESASRIGCIADIGFNYRVDRPGKLTTSPAKWINDLREAISASLSYVLPRSIDEEAGAAIIYSFLRPAFYYSRNLPPELRRRFLIDIITVFSQVPDDWVRCALRTRMHPDRDINTEMKLALVAITEGDLPIAMRLAEGRNIGRQVPAMLIRHRSTYGVVREYIRDAGYANAISEVFG